MFARHDLAGQIRRSDFVEDFYEARLGFGISPPAWLKSVRELGLSGAYYFEDPFSGYTVGLQFAF